MCTYHKLMQNNVLLKGKYFETNFPSPAASCPKVQWAVCSDKNEQSSTLQLNSYSTIGYPLGNMVQIFYP